MRTPTEKVKSQSDRRRDRAEMRDSLPALAFIAGAQAILWTTDPDGFTPANVIWALLSVAAVAWFVWVQVRSLRRADEYQRRFRLEALAIGFGAVMVLATAGSILDALEIGDPRQYLHITSGGGMLAWLGAHGLMTR